MHKTKLKKTGGSCCNRKCPKYRQRIALPMKVKYVSFIALALTSAHSFKPPNSKLFGYR
ncbi:hypothetical protein [Ruminococcus sp.]|uniref:hypothetical protein n=1 Tax=Ruminococcus sp. TaxID=41978 RepID=UPI003079C8F2